MPRSIRSWSRCRARPAAGRPRRCRATDRGTPRRARRGVDHLAALEAQPHPATSRPPMVAGQMKDLALHRVLDRPGEELAVGHVVLAITRDDPVAQRRPASGRFPRDDPHLLVALDPCREPVAFIGRASRPRGVGVVGEAGAEVRKSSKSTGSSRHRRRERPVGYIVPTQRCSPSAARFTSSPSDRGSPPAGTAAFGVDLGELAGVNVRPRSRSGSRPPRGAARDR